MDKSDYLQEKEKELKDILDGDTKLISYTNQIFAKRINAVFEEKYDENYLWRYALYLSSKGSLLLEENPQNPIGIESLRRAAVIYESLYYVSEKYDKGYSLILSSLCYDLSGYQANAQCLIDKLIKEQHAYYSLEEVDKEYGVISEYENKILKTVQLFLQKKIFLLSGEIDNLRVENHKELSSHYRNAFKEYYMAMKSLSTFILMGKRDGDFLESITNSYKEILFSGNVPLSHIIGLFKTRLRLLKERNIWDVVDKQGKLPNSTWEKYLKLLSMDVYGIGRIKSEAERTSIFEFWKSQLKAINEGIISTNKNFVVQMPTSAGKTLIAEIMIVDSLIENPDSKCIYIAPFRALTTEIEETLTNSLGKLGFIVSGATGSYEVDELQQFWIDNSDVLIATPEKIDLLYRLQPEFFENISLVVIDEGHIIGDVSERSPLLEFLIVKLRRKLENKCRFLFISAVMTKINAKEISEWLSGEEDNVISLPTIYGKEWEPTRKLFGMCWWDKEKASIIYPYERIKLEEPIFLPNIISETKYSYINPITGRGNTKTFPQKNNKSETAVELAYKFIDEGTVLIFSSRPDWVKSIGKAFLRLLDTKEKSHEEVNAVFNYRDYIESIEMAKKWLGEDDIVTKCLIRGVGIHYGSLPEPVRKSIEKDFREKRFKVLISTNTIGQGVNFPIKTAIIHSLEIHPEVGKKVSIRDFWNIAGRAGRAGRETEGQIIFLAFKGKDKNLFKEYTDKANIEESKSLLLRLLKKLIEKRISLDKFKDELEYLIEPSLLNLLVEETVDTLDEEFIKEILGYSLFMIQSEKEGYDIAPLVEGMLTIGRKFYSKVEDNDLRKLYSKTGFHLASCNKLSEFIESNINELNEIIKNDDYKSLLRKSIDVFYEIREMNEKKEKLDSSILKGNNEILSDFVMWWIKGMPISELKTLWDNSFSETDLKDKIQLYINQFLNYRYPWGITAFLLILIYHLNRHFDDMPEDFKNLPEKVRNLPSFIKYGLNNIPACMAKSVGVSTREASIEIAGIYSGGNDFKEFIIWFANLDVTDIKSLDISEFERKNVLYLSQKLNVEKWAIKTFEPIKCDVKGIPYEEGRKKLSEEVNIDDTLTLERDFENPYDIYAIKLMFGDVQLGFIPRDIAKILAIEMDLNGRKFQAKIIYKIEIKDLYIITVEISEYINK